MAKIEKTIIIKADTSDVNKKLKGLDKQVEKTTTTAKKSGKGLSGAFKSMGTAISGAIPMLGKLKAALISTGVGAIVVALGAFVGLMRSAAQAGANFQKGLSTLRAVTGNTADELSVLNEQAKELGATTQFTAIQVVGLQTELAKLGFTIKDIENSTPAILDLAASLEIDLASAAEFAGSVVRSFGLTTKDTQRVVDVMAKSTSTSALNFEALRESIKVVAPAARATGVSIEKTAALLGILANNGLKGSVAGTGLSKTFIELNKKGITLEDGMSKVANSSNKLNTAIELVGVVGAKSFLSLAESGQAITDLEQQFLAAEGAAKSMAEVRLDNLEGDMTKLGSAWEGFLLGIEDGEGPLNDLQRTLVKGLTIAVSKLGFGVDVLAFAFNELWTNSKLLAGGSKDFLVGVFNILGNAISLFSNKAKLAFSEIPLIGKAIDKKAVEANIAEAEAGILKGAKLLQQSSDKFRESAINTLTAGARFRVQQEGKAERIAMAEEAKLKEQEQIKIDEESEEKRLEREKAQEELRKQIKKAADQELKNKLSLLQQIEDAENDFFNRSLTKQELEIQAVNDKYFNLIEQAKKYGEDTSILEQAQGAELLAIKDANTKASIELSEKEAEAKKQNLAKVGNALGSFAQLAGKETAAGKALAISQALISTYQSAQSSYASLAPIPIIGPALGIAAAGAAVAGGLKQIQSIKSVKVPNSGGGGASVGGGVGAAPAPPSFNVVGASGSSQLADAIGGQSQQPVQAYVVANDITTAQSLQNNIVEGATIG
jgi:hypothetical protein